MKKCDYFNNASVQNLESFRWTERGKNPGGKNMKRREVFQFSNNYLSNYKTGNSEKKIRLCEWKSFVAFEMPVKTIFHSSVSYEGS